VYYFFLDRPQFARMKLYNIRAVFFNRGSAEPLCSASGCQGFRRNRPKLPGTKFATTVLCGCSNGYCSTVQIAETFKLIREILT